MFADKVEVNDNRQTMKPRTYQRIQKIISGYTIVYPSDFNMKTNKKLYVVSRQLLNYFIRKEHPKLTLSEIAAITGQNHSTIIHAIKTIEMYYQMDDDVIRNVKGFKSVLDNMSIHIKARNRKVF